MLSDWVLSTCLAFSGQAILTYALVKMLRLRHLVLIWVTAFLSCVVTGYLNAFPVDPQIKAVWSFGSFVVMVGMYWWFSAVKPMRRLFVTSCSIAAALLSEFPLAALFTMQGYSIDAISNFAYERMDVFVVYLTLHAMAMVVLLLLVYGLADRAFSHGGEWGGMRVAVFPMAQLCLILVVSFAERDIVKQDESFMLLTALSTSVVLVAYLVGFLTVRHWHNVEIADLRVRNLKERSELVVRQTEGFIAETERLAKLRHDFKNQLQVAEFLRAKGEQEQALIRLGCLETAVKQRPARS